jgi:hypothetical protein
MITDKSKGIEIIRLSKDYFTIIDSEDLPRVSKYKWHTTTVNKYNKPRAVCSFKGRKTLKLSRLIMNAPDNMVVDHINGNPLDNRKCNLRICSQRENMLNRNLNRNNKSGYKGVSWSKRDNKWLSELQTNNKSYYLGIYKDKIEAAKAYDKKAIEFFGEYAKTNFPQKLNSLKKL